MIFRDIRGFQSFGNLGGLNQSKMENAAQRLWVGFDGTRPDADLAHLIGTLGVGGIILFARNIETPDGVRDLCRSAQDLARAAGRPPLFIAVDQEGGSVRRLRPPDFPDLPAPRRMTDPTTIQANARQTARLLRRLGINVNFAPVMDVAFAGIDSVMADRAYGTTPSAVADRAAAVIRTHQAFGVMATAKHFPGIGRTTLDSHKDLPVLDTDRETLLTEDLVPFRSAISAGVAAVMLAHVRYLALDPDWPASLSDRIADGLLRREMGFAGLVLTDDLDMGAIRRHVDLDTAVHRAVVAKVDGILLCHRSPDIERAAEILREAAAKDPEGASAALSRIQRLKARLISPV